LDRHITTIIFVKERILQN